MSPILICAATVVESQACARGIAHNPSSDRFEILRTGVGMDAAASMLKRRLAIGPKPASIVSTGFAGALDHEITYGSWAWGRTVSSNGSRPLEAAPPPAGLLRIDLPWVPAHYCSVDQIVTTQISTITRSALDMESFAWAKLAHEHKIPFHIIRVISDTRDLPLPAAIRSWTDCMTEKNVARKLKTAVRGAVEMSLAPREMGRFLVHSTGLLSEFSNGWSLLARHWPS